MKTHNLFLNFLCFSFSFYCPLVFAQGTTFGTEQIIVESTASGATDVKVADLDNDGDMDIVSASTDNNRIAWYKNNCSGNFGTQQIIDTNLDLAKSVHPTDLDSDGDIDVLSSGDDIVWYENDGSGNFSAPKIIISNEYAESIYAADLDNDGDIDVLSSSYKTTWYKNNGNQNFGTPQIISAGTSYGEGQFIYATDLDNDGDIDVLSACQYQSGSSAKTNEIEWYENDGNGSFAIREVTNGYLLGYPYSVHAADLDNDGDMDVLTTANGPTDYMGHKVIWYENDGTGIFGAGQIISDYVANPRAVYAADLDNDGDMDVLSASANDYKIAWYENDGSGNFGTQQIISSSVGNPHSVCAADLDNDGDIDVLSDGDKIAWYKNFLANAVCTNNGIDIKVHPNPVKNALYVEKDVAMPTSYILYNTAGSIVLQGSFATLTKTISVENLPRGMYYLQMNGEVFKVVKF